MGPPVQLAHTAGSVTAQHVGVDVDHDLVAVPAGSRCWLCSQQGLGHYHQGVCVGHGDVYLGCQNLVRRSRGTVFYAVIIRNRVLGSGSVIMSESVIGQVISRGVEGCEQDGGGGVLGHHHQIGFVLGSGHSCQCPRLGVAELAQSELTSDGR